MKSKINYPAIIVFYTIAVSCRYLTNKTEILNGIGNEYLRSILTGIGPALGVVAVFIIFKIKPVLSLKGNYSNLILPIALYWILPIVLISGFTYFSKGTFPWMIVFTILVYGLAEEIGWRGFLYQQFKGLPLLANVLIVSSLWFLWHLNFELTLSNVLFYGILVFGSWGIGKVADSTNSLIAVSGFHSLNNFFSNPDSSKISLIMLLLFIWIIGLLIKKRKLNKREDKVVS